MKKKKKQLIIDRDVPKTILGTEVPKDVRGIVYFGKFNRDEKTLKITNEVFCNTPFKALNIYANARNPESQLITGGSYAELGRNLNILHDFMKDEAWLEMLSQSI